MENYKSKNKKYKLIKTIILMFFMVCIIFLFIYLNFFYPKISARSKDFSLYIEEYKQVADFYYKDFKEYNADLLVYSFPYDDNEKEIVCFTEGYKHKLIIDETIHQSFLKLLDSYSLDNQYLDHIVVYDGFVSFGNINLNSSYVYSIYDYEPKYISNPNNINQKLYVKKLSDKWYFACNNS